MGNLQQKQIPVNKIELMNILKEGHVIANDIDVSNITDMSLLFKENKSFNQPLVGYK